MRNSIAASLDSPKAINDLENEPAYKRRNVDLENVDEVKGNANLSKFEIGTDNDNPLKESNNSFLHENVD